MYIPKIIGLFGAILAGIAYLPQIIHLIKEHCSAGISQKAFIIWFIAAVAVSVEAISIQSPVFITLSFIQITATLIIIFFSYRYRGACPSHELKTE